LSDIDRLPSYSFASEFQDAASVIPRPAVVPDGDLGNPEITPAAYPSDPELHRSWIDLPPGDEVLFTYKALLGLRELQHGVVVIDFMTDVLVRGFVFPMAPQDVQQGCLIHVFAPYY
jgi:hypothetical protein